MIRLVESECPNQSFFVYLNWSSKN